jgi:uncharacterized lipoprotein YddW (UPF0748 family)
VDGIQGDDRLPAQPSEGGYEPIAVAAYRAEHNGSNPPNDPKDSVWLRWRADKLNEFARRIYREVKRLKPEVAVTWSPSVYPWSYAEYLQDWPSWIRQGSAEMVIPQVYRYDLEAYRQTLDSQFEDSVGVARSQRIIYPGILLNLGDYLASEEYLTGAMKYNRKRGYAGEVFFFFEGLRKNGGARARLIAEKFYAKAVPPPFPRFGKTSQ